ncbi:hypothetical protein [Nonomuraea ceibae]|uniref:hypothetical protein n=1 Tax=Nonomuraea ceibae TaxID=1935170 RepID=UPI001C5E5400|nr:hypothetical protein [Nonomuraea ceibae]
MDVNRLLKTAGEDLGALQETPEFKVEFMRRLIFHLADYRAKQVVSEWLGEGE